MSSNILGAFLAKKNTNHDVNFTGSYFTKIVTILGRVFPDVDRSHFFLECRYNTE